MKTLCIIRNPKRVPTDIPCVFRVGEPVTEGGHVVKQILYCRDGYTNGPGKDPCYIVKYEDILTVNQIPASEIVDITVDPEDKKKKADPAPSEASIELPE
jgi:hypothetical protein